MIHIIIPVHNRKELTRRCLESLKTQSLQDFTMIVVDDGSTDGTGDMIRKEFPSVVIFFGDGNLWWTGAVNRGLKYALAKADEDDLILLLNDDVIVNADYLERLRRASLEKPKSIIGSVEVWEESPRVIQSGGVLLNRLTAKLKVLNRGQDLLSFAPHHFEEVSILPGRGTLYPSSVFREIGLFDDIHFQACGDTELPLRAVIAGYELLVCYDAIVITTHGGSDIPNINYKSRYRMSDVAEYFFGPRSNFRLKYRWYFSQSISKSKLTCFVYFLFDTTRIGYHFLSRFSVK